MVEDLNATRVMTITKQRLLLSDPSTTAPRTDNNPNANSVVEYGEKGSGNR